VSSNEKGTFISVLRALPDIFYKTQDVFAAEVTGNLKQKRPPIANSSI
jgi:hypothetical protein